MGYLSRIVEEFINLQGIRETVADKRKWTHAERKSMAQGSNSQPKGDLFFPEWQRAGILAGDTGRDRR